MGGDDAPPAILEGAQIAARSGVDVVVCGTPEALANSDLPWIQSGPAVAMDADPAMALRRDPQASVRVAARAVAANPGSALVSAGSTGATVAAALLEMGRAGAGRRPVIAARLPTSDGGTVLLLDAGAFPDITATTLAGYATIGADHARRTGVSAPRIGLLNVGHEPGKGNQLTRDAAALLSEVTGFVGGVEPGPALAGAVDVLVADGFTGNILLKTLESLNTAQSATDVDRAALVLGVSGTVLVAHGAATAKEVAAAIMMAARMTAEWSTESTAARPDIP